MSDLGGSAKHIFGSVSDSELCPIGDRPHSAVQQSSCRLVVCATEQLGHVEGHQTDLLKLPIVQFGSHGVLVFPQGIATMQKDQDQVKNRDLGESSH